MATYNGWLRRGVARRTGDFRARPVWAWRFASSCPTTSSDGTRAHLRRAASADPDHVLPQRDGTSWRHGQLSAPHDDVSTAPTSPSPTRTTCRSAEFPSWSDRGADAVVEVVPLQWLPGGAVGSVATAKSQPQRAWDFLFRGRKPGSTHVFSPGSTRPVRKEWP